MSWLGPSIQCWACAPAHVFDFIPPPPPKSHGQTSFHQFRTLMVWHHHGRHRTYPIYIFRLRHSGTSWDLIVSGNATEFIDIIKFQNKQPTGDCTESDKTGKHDNEWFLLNWL
ncbi:unnamed protein product [Orchesella dallaii]|uniref:Uncharacterized protein n=1 Tax=Orchesella dallaii TaxID=48710 RepID=A0ABP1S470_9HEXA